MSTPVTGNDKSYMQDRQGRLIPEDMVSDLDKLRDQTVKGIFAKAMAMQEHIVKCKAEIREDLLAYLSISSEKYGRKAGGRKGKGNIQMSSYDGELQLRLVVGEQIAFDERLQVAKENIDDCISRWTAVSSSEVKALINDAFRIDQQGSVNARRILSLRRLPIEHPQWKQAMEAISDSVQVVGSKEYVRFYQRDENGQYHNIGFDFTTI